MFSDSTDSLYQFTALVLQHDVEAMTLASSPFSTLSTSSSSSLPSAARVARVLATLVASSSSSSTSSSSNAAAYDGKTGRNTNSGGSGVQLTNATMKKSAITGSAATSSSMSTFSTSADARTQAASILSVVRADNYSTLTKQAAQAFLTSRARAEEAASVRAQEGAYQSTTFLFRSHAPSSSSSTGTGTMKTIMVKNPVAPSSATASVDNHAPSVLVSMFESPEAEAARLQQASNNNAASSASASASATATATKAGASIPASGSLASTAVCSFSDVDPDGSGLPTGPGWYDSFCGWIEKKVRAHHVTYGTRSDTSFE